jgi:hypothetical protein
MPWKALRQLRLSDFRTELFASCAWGLLALFGNANLREWIIVSVMICVVAMARLADLLLKAKGR